MLLGIIASLIIALIFDVPLLEVLVVGAIFQCVTAYFVSQNPILLKIGGSFVLVVVGQFLILPALLTQPDLLLVQNGRLASIQGVFDWLAGASAIVIIVVSTILGLIGPTE